MFSLAPALRAPLALALAGACLAVHALPAEAQTTLNPIVVTATREPLALDRVTADLVVIDGRRVRDSGADSLEDLLRREAGLQVSRNGGPGSNATVFIRGAGSGNTLVLVDGVRVGSATLGQVELESIGLAQIDRIEVLRGPGSSLYGADAGGGVIQIFTRRGDADAGRTRVSAQAALGGKSSRVADLAVSGVQGSLDFAAAAGHERSDGVSALRAGDAFGNFNPDADGFRRSTAQLRLGWTPVKDHRIGASFVKSRLNAKYDGSEFLPPAFAQDATPDFRTRLSTQVASLDYRGRFTDTWTTSVQIARNEDDALSGASAPDRFRTKREQLTWQNALAIDADQKLVLALERLEEKALSSVYLAEAERSNRAVLLGYSAQFGAHALQADVRHDDSSVYGGVDTGRLGWSQALTPAWRVRAVGGTSFRAPSFNDLVFPGYGVLSVQPERGRSVEVGVAWQDGGRKASATVYRNRFRDLIAYEPDRSFCPADPSYDFGCARNVNRATLKGLTLDGSLPWGAWTLRGTLDFLDATDSATGERLPRRAAHQESLIADYDGGAWSAGASALRLGSRPDGGKRLGGYTTIDLRSAWRFAPQWRLEARLRNATDRDIEPARDYQDLGRQAWIGLRFDGLGF
jgi:vitamin B12 transporter